MKKCSAILSAPLLIIGFTLASHALASSRSRLHDDVVRDGSADLIFSGGSALAFWRLTDSGSAYGPSFAGSFYAGDAGPGYRVVAVSDFDGEGSADVLWSNGAQLKMWINNGAGGYTPVAVAGYGGGWQPFAAGDINGDGKSDLFFRGGTHLAYWLLDGPEVIGSSYAGDGGAGYRVVALDNFMGPTHGSRVDVLWTNGTDLKMWVNHVPNWGSFFPFVFASYGNGWEPFATGDVDGNGTIDILFRGSTHVAYWANQYNGASDHYPYWFFESRYAGDGGAGFSAIAVSYYDGDSSADIIWSNGSQIKIWNDDCGAWDVCGGHAYVSNVIGSFGGGWQPLNMLVGSY